MVLLFISFSGNSDDFLLWATFSLYACAGAGEFILRTVNVVCDGGGILTFLNIARWGVGLV